MNPRLLRSSLLSLLLVAGAPAQGTAPAAPKPPADRAPAITVAELEENVRWLAADARKGRQPGTPENEAVAAWIEQSFKELGLAPKGEGGSFRHRFRAANKVVTNVCGFLKGRRRPREVVVIGAHFDHVGLGLFGSRTGARGQIHNGADDNGSGTAALLELAEAFAQDPPERSLLFVAFNAEEMGLLGSKAWVKRPTVPLGAVVAMLNLDMIGRSRGGYCFVGGVHTARGFPALVERANAKVELKLELAGGGRGPSDFDPFFLSRKPVLFLFTGEHEDYHTPADDAERLSYAELKRIADFAHALTVGLASGARPRFLSDSRQAMPATSPRAPDLANQMLGLGVARRGELRVQKVRRGGPGQLVGLREGDLLRALDGVEVGDGIALHRELARRRIGAVVKLTVQRGRGRKTLRLRLDGPTETR